MILTGYKSSHTFPINGYFEEVTGIMLSKPNNANDLFNLQRYSSHYAIELNNVIKDVQNLIQCSKNIFLYCVFCSYDKSSDQYRINLEYKQE